MLYLAAVADLASRLPDRLWAINLCRDRVRFLIAFGAVIARGGASLLLPNNRPGAISAAKEQVGSLNTYLLSDGPESDVALSLSPKPHDIPAQRIAPGHCCLAAFTSGTTGSPERVTKSWHTIVESTRINRIPYLGNLGTSALPAQIVATVPPQHMYGLESSIFMPLLAPAAIHPARPLLPADVAGALRCVPSPRILVTTPAHLNALVNSTVDFPTMDRIVSATAPLSPDLASTAERRLGAPLIEIFGCSEAGSLARRETARELHWQLFDGFVAAPEAGDTAIKAQHLPDPVVLADTLSWHDSRHFDLAGRESDQVNVAGKRASLQALTHILLRQRGVLDAVVLQPPHTRRLAALVVAPERDPAELRQDLRQHLDDLLVPRPILKVAALPRNDTGKLPLADVLALYEQSL